MAAPALISFFSSVSHQLSDPLVCESSIYLGIFCSRRMARLPNPSTNRDRAGTIVSAPTDELRNHPTRGAGASLQVWRVSVETLMDATFDPYRATSAFARLNQILADAGQSHSQAAAVCSTRMQRSPPWLG